MTTYPLTDIVPATVSDVPLILDFIKQLAVYEKLAHEVVATPELLEQHLFGASPKAEVILAYHQKTADSERLPVGFALFFHNFSTFLGRPGLYLEDLFVDPAYRGMGLGKKLLQQLAVIAKERDCGRYEWVVLDWNKPSREFYESLGAKPQGEWIIHRVEGKSLDDLASM
ncbi:acyl-CoA N-acyltransferase [Absidia repens]|uniref:Acyl-CoA N-acyltransferase n=1 Tax=Absidia repens TaxID=90262 RepID=A0A1X2HY85_9FUNG|nr:acyl-CoA N-acyltransferase [Absidia repens]